MTTSGTPRKKRVRKFRCFGPGVYLALGVFLALAVSPASPAWAQSAPPSQKAEAPPPSAGPYSGDFWSRSTLTGDWGGFRNTMAEKGVTLDVEFTQIGQGVVSGGRDIGWEYQGRGQITMNLDTQKLGLWPGGFLTVVAEGNYGEDVNFAAGAVLGAVNTSANFPTAGKSQFVLPHLYYTQFFSEYAGVILGKLDTTNGDANAFAHGKGDAQFFNLAFNLNPANVLTTPSSTLGAGLIVLPTKDPKEWVVSATVYDPFGRADTPGFDTLFANGAVVAGETRLTTHFFDLTGHQLVGGIYSTANYTSLDQPLLNLILPGLPVGQSSYSWAVYYNFDQYLYQPEKNVDRGLGLFGRFGVSDGVANPAKYFYSIGLGGKGLIPGRPLDQFGIGYYYGDVSDARVLSRLNFRDTQGFEAYYNFALTPWAQLSPDIQVNKPSQRRLDTAVVVGFRLKLVF